MVRIAPNDSVKVTAGEIEDDNYRQIKRKN